MNNLAGESGWENDLSIYPIVCRQTPNLINSDVTQLSCIYIVDVKCNVACNVEHDVAPYLLTLVNRNNPICVASPRWPRQVQSSVALTDRFANECCQCKPSIIGSGLPSCQTVGSLL